MVDLDDDWPEMDFYHNGPCIAKWPVCFKWEIGAILEISPMYLPLAVKTEVEKWQLCIKQGWNILYMIYVHYDYIHLLTCILLW